MKPGLTPGIRYQHNFQVPESKTVPQLYPEAQEFLEMPEVFATGYLVGLLEWACILAIKPHIDWPAEQSLGTHVNVSHEAATLPGMEVTVSVELLQVDRRRLVFSVEAHDGIEVISRGTHERFVIDRQKFTDKLSQMSQRKTR